jgi:hypothetical protein
MESTECFQVRIVSENSKALCGYTPSELFALATFQSLFPSYQQKSFTTFLHNIHKTFLQSGNSQDANQTTVSFIDAQGKPTRFSCVAYFVGGESNLLVCEFEPWKPPAGPRNDLPTMPEYTMDSNTSSSSASHGRLFKTLAKAEDTSMECLAIMGQIHRRFASSQTVPALLDHVAEVIYDLMDCHRCTVSQFDSQHNGKVIVELINPRASVDSCLGLSFPASDLPSQARDLVRTKILSCCGLTNHIPV